MKPAFDMSSCLRCIYSIDTTGITCFKTLVRQRTRLKGLSYARFN
ncbi:MAG: hypothetical protein ACTS82_06370 [Arsenophonus sp. ET-DL12-MAG3]